MAGSWTSRPYPAQEAGVAPRIGHRGPARRWDPGHRAGVWVLRVRVRVRVRARAQRVKAQRVQVRLARVRVSLRAGTLVPV